MNTPSDTASPAKTSYRHLLRRRQYFWGHRAKLDDPGLRAEMQWVALLNLKVQGYDWVREQGVPTVNYGLHDDIDTALATDLPHSFVVKPLTGHSSAGVFLLTRRADGQYACTMTNKVYPDLSAVAAAFHDERRRMPKTIVRPDVIIEEVVEDRQGYDVPLDYKVYAFQTGSPIVMQRYAPRHLPKSKWAFAFYDREGRDLGLIRQETADNAARVGLRPPDNLEALFETSDQLIRATGVSFFRIDLYTTPKGVVFGEFTGVPNNAKEYYSPEWEVRLGRYWLDSLDQMGLSYD